MSWRADHRRFRRAPRHDRRLRALEIQTHFEIIKLPSDVYSISTLPMKISPMDIFLIAALTVLLCLLSTLYPSYKASTIDPVETLEI